MIRHRRHATGFVGRLSLWMERARERRRLAELPEDRLQDLGLRAEEAAVEAAKPFWRP